MPEYNVPEVKNVEEICPCGRPFMTAEGSCQPFCPVCKMDIDAQEECDDQDQR